jgi:hypothetical protein
MQHSFSESEQRQGLNSGEIKRGKYLQCRRECPPALAYEQVWGAYPCGTPGQHWQFNTRNWITYYSACISMCMV